MLEAAHVGDPNRRTRRRLSRRAELWLPRWLPPAQRLRGPMSGWVIPPPSQSVKSDEDLRRERGAKVAELGRRGLLRSERLRRAMLIARREDFIPSRCRDHAYDEISLPLPGERATISYPHSYPLFYKPLGLLKGQRFLEVGVGSDYGTSLAREVVSAEGLVVGISTRQRSRSPGRTCSGRATPTSCSFTATGAWVTPSTPRTIGSA
jgi:hypothetical protein